MKPENTLLKNAIFGTVYPNPNMSNDDAWEMVKDVVDYPVVIRQAYWETKENEKVVADGKSPQGKDKSYKFVIVDKYRDNDPQVVASVTDLYGTLKTTSVYDDLKLVLNELNIDHKVNRVSVSGNGGAQQLVVELSGLKSMNSGVPDNVVMRMVFNTSVDGTKHHQLVSSIYNEDSDSEWYFHGGDYKLTARHTKTISDRAIDFTPFVRLMVENWSTIINTMVSMCDYKFDKNLALAMLEKIADKAGMGERHQTELKNIYESGGVITNDKSDSLYRINEALNQYVDKHMEGKNELQEKTKQKISKQVFAQLKKQK